LTTAQTVRPALPPIWVLALAVSGANVGISILSPAIPDMRASLMATADEAQLVLGAFMVMLGLGQLGAGTLSDRVGRRPVLVYGSLLFTLSGLGAMMATSVEFLIAMRIFQGLGAATCMAMGRVIISDSFKGAEAGRQMSTITMFQSVVPLLGFAFGGMLADLVGWRGAIGLMAATAAVVFVATLLFLAESRDRSIPPLPAKKIIGVYGRLFVTPLFITNAVLSASVTAAFFAMGGFLPYEFQRLGSSAFEFGLYFSATPFGYMVGNSISRNVGPRFGLARVAFAGSLVRVLAMSGLVAVAVAGTGSQPVMSLLLFGYGVANGLVVANALVGAIKAAGPHSGAATGLCGAIQMAASAALGSLIIAFGGDMDFPLAISICWVATFSGAVCGWVALKRGGNA